MSEREAREPDPVLDPLLRAERERPALRSEVIERIRRRTEQVLTPPAPLEPSVPGGGASKAIATHALVLALGLGVGAAVGWQARGAPHERVASSSIVGQDARRTLPPSAVEPPARDARASEVVVPPTWQASPGVPSPSVPSPTDAVAEHTPGDAMSRTAAHEADREDGNGSALAAERRLVDAARAALAAGRFEAAERMLEDHRVRHPHGALSEEREALLVEAVAGQGRSADARALAARFLATHPGSLHGARVRRIEARDTEVISGGSEQIEEE